MGRPGPTNNTVASPTPSTYRLSSAVSSPSMKRESPAPPPRLDIPEASNDPCIPEPSLSEIVSSVTCMLATYPELRPWKDPRGEALGPDLPPPVRAAYTSPGPLLLSSTVCRYPLVHPYMSRRASRFAAPPLLRLCVVKSCHMREAVSTAVYLIRDHCDSYRLIDLTV